MKFKEYTQAQGTLFPHNFDDFIPENDPVRVINRAKLLPHFRQLLLKNKIAFRS